MKKGEGDFTTLNISNTAHASPRDMTRRLADRSSDSMEKFLFLWYVTLLWSSRLTRKTIEMTLKTIAVPQAIKCAWTNMISCVKSIEIERNKIPETEGKWRNAGGKKNMEAQCVKLPAQANLKNEGCMWKNPAWYSPSTYCCYQDPRVYPEQNLQSGTRQQ